MEQLSSSGWIFTKEVFDLSAAFATNRLCGIWLHMQLLGIWIYKFKYKYKGSFWPLICFCHQQALRIPVNCLNIVLWFCSDMDNWTIGYRHWHGQGEEGKVSFLTSVSRPVNNIGAAALSVNRPCQCCVGVDNGNDDIGSDQGNCPFYFPDCVVTTTTTMT